MTPSQWIELEQLAAKHSPEILRMLRYLTDEEARGNLTFLRRIDAEQEGGAK